MEQTFFKDLKKLISYESEKGESEKNAPFGKEVKNCLLAFLKLAKDFGFKVINYDNYAGEIIYGKGEEIGIIGHLDVVPKGTGWETPPYTLTEKDGYLIGRGISDDKGPCLATLYALKYLKDNKLPCNKKFRFFVGTNEESGWKDLEYLKSKTTLPKYGFSPDGNFPISYAEKGVYTIDVLLPELKNFSFIKAGTARNVVCGKAEILIKNYDKKSYEKFGLKRKENKLLSEGKSAHGSHPEMGVNALKNIFAFLLSEKEKVKNIYEYLFLDKAKIMNIKTRQGKVTFSPDIISKGKDGYHLIIDMRVPYPVDFNKKIKPLLDNAKLNYTFKENHPEFYVDKNCTLIKSLLNSYNEITKENAKPVALSGSTFARAFEMGAAFGFEFEDENYHMHEPNERIKIETFIKGYNILQKAIIDLGKSKEKL